MSRSIVPLADLDTRPPEAGRIRLGEKTAKAMRALETFRFTSQHEDLIEALAQKYGGTPSRWNEPKARVKNQWQVTTQTAEIDVFLPLGGLSTWYEMWGGGGCLRRCNGVTVEVPQVTPDGAELTTAPCICVAKNVLECRPYTRMNVLIPDIPFRGTWRLETKGWNAAKELPGMYQMISQLAAGGSLVDAKLKLEQRSSIANGKKSNFVVPTLTMSTTPHEMLEGGGQAAPALQAPDLVALPSGDDVVTDAEIVTDAEVVDREADDDLVVEQALRDVLPDGIDADAFVSAMWNQTKGDLSKISNATKRIRDGKLTPTGVTNGVPTWAD